MELADQRLSLQAEEKIAGCPQPGVERCRPRAAADGIHGGAAHPGIVRAEFSDQTSGACTFINGGAEFDEHAIVDLVTLLAQQSHEFRLFPRIQNPDVGPQVPRTESNITWVRS